MESELRHLYLDLIKKCLTDSIYGYTNPGHSNPDFDSSIRYKGNPDGRGWPSHAHTMLKMDRMNNLQECLERVIENGIPGDFIETGVWRGGATIFMRAVLKAYGIKGRAVWVADSFDGLPPPDTERYAADAGDNTYLYRKLAVSLETVKENFAKYGLLDQQVRFLKGWFKDTLPTIPAEQRFALIRLDGDMYGSTIEALENLYPKLYEGGICIIDDYGACPPCKQATEDFCAANRVDTEIKWVDWTAVYWQK